MRGGREHGQTGQAEFQLGVEGAQWLAVYIQRAQKYSLMGVNSVVGFRLPLLPWTVPRVHLY